MENIFSKEKLKFVLKWKIRNFTTLSNITNEKYFAVTTMYTLPINEQICFQLSFSPNGDSPSKSGYSAFILYLVKFPKDNMLINLTVSLIDEDGTKKFTKSDLIRFVFSLGTNSGWPDFVKLSKILNPANRLLTNDTLTVCFESELFMPQLLMPDIFPSKMEIPQRELDRMCRQLQIKKLPVYPEISEDSIQTCKFAHIWRIDNFVEFLNNPNQDHDYIDSNSFFIPLDETIQFYLRIHPNGFHKQTENYVDITLRYIANGLLPNTTIDWEFYILDGKYKKFNKKGFSLQLKVVNGKSQIVPLLKYISHADLLNLRNVFLPDDSLTILCEICAILHPTIKKVPETEKLKYGFIMSSKQLSSEVDFTESRTCAKIKPKMAEYTWTIENVNKSRTEVTNMFSTELNYVITLIPEGMEGFSDDVSIMTMLIGHKDVTFRTKISIVDMFGNKDYFKENQQKNENKYLIFRFINRKFLLNPANGLLTNNELKIHFEITLIEDIVPSTNDNSLASDPYSRRLCTVVDNFLYKNLFKYCLEEMEETNISTQMIRLFHKFTVKNFETYFYIEKEKFIDVKTDKFFSPANDKFKCCLCLCSKGLPKMSEKTDCLFILAIVDSYGLARNSVFKIELGLVDQRGKKFKIKELLTMHMDDFEMHDGGFISLGELFNRKNKLLKNGNLTLYQEIHIYDNDNSTNQIVPNDKFVANANFNAPWNIAKQTEVMSCSQSKTELKILNCDHKWTIDKFSSYGDDFEEPQCLKSELFSSKDNDRIQFFLEVFPNGENAQNRNIVNINLNLSSSDKSKVIVNMKMSIMNKRGKKFNVKENSLKLNASSDMSWPEFIRHDYLVENDLLLADKLTIYYEIQILLEPINHPIEYEKVLIQDDLNYLLTQNLPTDIVLTFDGDTKKLYAHKCILSAQSKIFEKMFEHEMQEKASKKVKIVDVPLQVFEVLLTFMYTGKVDFRDIEMVIELFIVADKYELKQLKIDCEEWLCTNVTKETASELLVLSDMHHADQLKAYALNYIRKHPAKIAQTENFQKLVKNRPDLIEELNIDFENLDVNSCEIDNEDDDEDVSVL